MTTLFDGRAVMRGYPKEGKIKSYKPGQNNKSK